MKKNYNTPKAEIIKLEKTDIIKTSGGTTTEKTLSKNSDIHTTSIDVSAIKSGEKTIGVFE